MARNQVSDSIAKRARLAPSKNPYWQGVAGGRGGVSLGYRKAKRGPGSWIVKLALDGNRLEERLAPADDARSGPEALSYPAAVTAALAWARNALAGLEDAGSAAVPIAIPTVRTAVDRYIAVRKLRNAAAARDAESRLTRHVFGDPAFADLQMGKLTAKAIRDWRSRLPDSLAGTTVNRLLNDLRAALNASAEQHRRSLPPGVPAEIKSGTKAISTASAARKQVLPDAEIRRLVEAAFEADDTGDFGRLALVLASTGARFSQVARITVGDVQIARRRIMVMPSRKGRAGKKPTPIAVPVGDDVISRLTPIVSGRRGDEVLLLHWRHRQVAPVQWERVDRQPWLSASAATRSWEKACALAEAPAGTVMLCLRHSSIVRALSAGVPVRLVAALHDTSVQMIEDHYSAYIVDATEEIARRAVTPLTSASVTTLRPVSEAMA